MSLVGPRPLTPADAARLTAVHPPFAARFAVPPGLTGLAQVCLAQGVALTSELDAAYVRTRSARLDLQILLRTAWMNLVGKRRGALRPRAPDLLTRTTLSSKTEPTHPTRPPQRPASRRATTRSQRPPRP
jgi:hypothetical protein